MTFLTLWGPALFVMGLIFFFSSLSDPGAPPGGLSDKVAHFAVYAALGGTLLRALARARPDAMTFTRAIHASVLATLYGLSEEIHQSFVPARTADWRDLVADAAGGLAGAFALLVLARAVSRVRGPRRAVLP